MFRRTYNKLWNGRQLPDEGVECMRNPGSRTQFVEDSASWNTGKLQLGMRKIIQENEAVLNAHTVAFIVGKAKDTGPPI